jgi:hypothetical protein
LAAKTEMKKPGLEAGLLLLSPELRRTGHTTASLINRIDLRHS